MAPLADAAPGREEALPALAGRRVPVSEASRRVALTSGSDGVLLTPADSPRSAAESPGASRDGGGASSPSLARMPAIAPRSRVHKPASDSPLKSAHRDRPRTLSRSRTATAKVLAEVAGWIPEDAPSPGATTGFVPTPQFGKVTPHGSLGPARSGRTGQGASKATGWCPASVCIWRTSFLRSPPAPRARRRPAAGPSPCMRWRRRCRRARRGAARRTRPCATSGGPASSHSECMTIYHL